MDEKQEFRLRRKAIRMHLQGNARQEILAKVHRSRAWLSKWQKRFDQQGISGLHSHSRRPASHADNLLIEDEATSLFKRGDAW